MTEKPNNQSDTADSTEMHEMTRLEGLLGLQSSGAKAARISALVSAVERKVSEWEKMAPSRLMRDGDLFSALFRVVDNVDISSYVNQGRLPDIWWAQLAMEINKLGFYNRLTVQIHRETHASIAQRFLKDERAFGGRAKAERSPVAKVKEAARTLWPEAHRMGWTADKFHRELAARGHGAAFETVRKWMTQWRRDNCNDLER